MRLIAMKALPLLLLPIFVLLTAFSYRRLAEQPLHWSTDLSQQTEVLYLPSGAALDFISFGYQDVLAHVLWFNTISYFGKHFKSDQNYTWLGHMCDLVTTLNPRVSEVFEFCSLMLAWEAQKPEASMALLDRAIAYQPDYWRYYYLRGINSAFFLGDEELAQQDFLTGSRLPEAPPFMARLAVKKLANLADPESAVEFLEEMVAATKDPTQRAALADHLNKTRHEINLERLQSAVDRYHSDHGRWPASWDELAAYEVPAADLRDPFGGVYLIEPETGRVKSSSRVRRIRLFRSNGKG